jgi:uncharacterized protein (TIGR02001 family)
MNKRIVSIVLGALCAGALTAHAQDSAPAVVSPPPAPAAAPPALDVTLTPTYVSQYMFRGQRLSGQSFQPSVEADYGSWALGVWSSTPIDNEAKVPGQSDPEVDPYGSYTFALNDNLSLQPGFTWYTYPHANPQNGFYRMTFEPNLALNYTVYGLKLTPKFYRDLVLDQNTYELSGTYAVPLKDEGTELDFTGTAGTYEGTHEVDHASPDVKAWGNYWLLGVSAPFQITKNSKLTVGWAYTEGNDAYFKQAGTRKVPNSAAVGRGVATVSYAWTF